MKILTARQTKSWEKATCESLGIDSYTLVWKAARSFADPLCQRFSPGSRVLVIAGPGNNGADGMALSKLLQEQGMSVDIFLAGADLKHTAEWKRVYEEIRQVREITLKEINSDKDFPALKKFDLIIDAIFGTGLNRPAEGMTKDLIAYINNSKKKCPIVSLDIPSGMFADMENSPEDLIVKSNLLLTVEQPKLSFFFKENFPYIENFEITEIGLDPKSMKNIPSNYEFVERPMIDEIFKSRPRVKGGYKGMYGKAMLAGGNLGYQGQPSMMGAIVLASWSALRTGVGKLFVHIPKWGRDIVHISVPEAIADLDENPETITEIKDPIGFDCIGVGPGLGVNDLTLEFMVKLLKTYLFPIVFDADALSLLCRNSPPDMDDTGGWQNEAREEARNDEFPDKIQGLLLFRIPKNSILTPHFGEFLALYKSIGSTKKYPAFRASGEGDMTEWQAMLFGIEMAKLLGVFIVLKGAYTKIITPEGKVFINSTGNRGMAKAGMGDVLTGLITGFLAQGFSPLEASIAGVFIHGFAGDLAQRDFGTLSMKSGDVVRMITRAVKTVEN